MRILHVTPYFQGAWAYGGIPRVAAATVRGLARQGHTVTVCTTDAWTAAGRLPASDPSRAHDVRCEVRVFPNLSNAAAYHLQLFLPVGLSGYLRRRAGSFDVAHIHGCHHLPGSIAARWLRRGRVPYVLTPHGTGGFIERRQVAKRLFDATVGRGVVVGAARIIAVSAAERTQLIELGLPPARIKVVPNPMDLAEFEHVARGAFRSRLHLTQAQPIVLYLGKLTPRKRLDTLVEAFAALAHPEARLVIAGNDMGYGRQLRQVIDRLGVSDRVTMTGLLSGCARLEALVDADVVAYASELEVFGLVPVEALMCGTPVVVANDNGCGEVIAETGGGLQVPPGDAPTLRRALEAILAARVEWRAKAAATRSRIVDRYSADAVAARLESLYTDVLSATDTCLSAAV